MLVLDGGCSIRGAGPGWMLFLNNILDYILDIMQISQAGRRAGGSAIRQPSADRRAGGGP
jgi:hypothetical protein